MQSEIDSQNTARPIQILGVNGIGLESSNGEMIAGRVLPWLQPVEGNDVWTLWQVEYRDVVILGPHNEHLGDNFNLTVHNLSDPANYSTLMNRLLEAANQ